MSQSWSNARGGYGRGARVRLAAYSSSVAARRQTLQRSKAPLKELAAQHGLNAKTVAKWRKRAFVHDAAMGPKAPRSTVLTPEEEAAAVALRRHTLLPLGDWS